MLLTVVIRCGSVGKLSEDFPFSQSLKTHNTSDAMFNSLNDFIIGNEIGWSVCTCQYCCGSCSVGEVQWTHCTYSRCRIDSLLHTLRIIGRKNDATQIKDYAG
jgi:hypothetical protein